MIEETDLSQEKTWFYEERAKTAVKNFARHNIIAQYVSSRQQALEAVLEMIPAGASVARGDSISVDEIGIIPALEANNRNTVTDPLARNPDGSLVFPQLEDRNIIARQAFTSDVFLVGANAVTIDGKLVNIDGWGNRVAPMIFGPEKVIVVAGANKLVKNVEEALDRVRNYAAPVNVKRHYLKHNRPEFGDIPCMLTGRCTDCYHNWRICRYTVIIEGSMIREKGRINVVLVGENLGI